MRQPTPLPRLTPQKTFFAAPHKRFDASHRHVNEDPQQDHQFLAADLS